MGWVILSLTGCKLQPGSNLNEKMRNMQHNLKLCISILQRIFTAETYELKYSQIEIYVYNYNALNLPKLGDCFVEA